MADIKAIAEELVNLTVKEVNELATVLKDEYGIEPAAAAVAVAAGPAAGAAEAAEEKSSFDVVLKSAGDFLSRGVLTFSCLKGRIPENPESPVTPGFFQNQTFFILDGFKNC